uniref:Uncharacterized protein n=1 Tax=Meloidogyne enterolobii TaxID=390850 RepID=A0A6V7WY32_MELEN|nr:unnamed protein product [Meloidogyne enterolobii]
MEQYIPITLLMECHNKPQMNNLKRIPRRQELRLCEGDIVEE